MTKMNRPLTDAELNHLRKLLSWIDCEIGQAPDEMVGTLKKIAPAIGAEVEEEGRFRLKAAYDKSVAVPHYVRAAVKALRKTLAQHQGEVLDVDAIRTVQHIEQ